MPAKWHRHRHNLKVETRKPKFTAPLRCSAALLSACIHGPLQRVGSGIRHQSILQILVACEGIRGRFQTESVTSPKQAWSSGAAAASGRRLAKGSGMSECLPLEARGSSGHMTPIYSDVTPGSQKQTVPYLSASMKHLDHYAVFSANDEELSSPEVAVCSCTRCS